MKKRIVLCADDYGQDQAVSEGILQLLAKSRLTATSCMVNSPDWPHFAPALKPYYDRADIGLHFNLTDGYALSKAYQSTYSKTFPTLSTLLRKAFLQQLDQSIIEAELHAQIDAFAESADCLPHYIDGHQHVHQFPVIRSALMRVYSERFKNSNAYIRLVDMKLTAHDLITNPKKYIIYWTGTAALKQLLIKNNIPHNTSFSGIYSFDRADNYPQFFEQFLAESKDGGLIMTHPGLPSTQKNDPIYIARNKEFIFIGSAAFEHLCDKYQVALCKRS